MENPRKLLQVRARNSVILGNSNLSRGEYIARRSLTFEAGTMGRRLFVLTKCQNVWCEALLASLTFAAIVGLVCEGWISGDISIIRIGSGEAVRKEGRCCTVARGHCFALLEGTAPPRLDAHSKRDRGFFLDNVDGDVMV